MDSIKQIKKYLPVALVAELDVFVALLDTKSQVADAAVETSKELQAKLKSYEKSVTSANVDSRYLQYEQEISELRNAPTDNGIKELDALCEKFNKGEINTCTLVCDIWNKAHWAGIKEQRAADKVINHG